MSYVAPLLALVVMEIILGIDNIIFLSIVVSGLPAAQQGRARAIGLGLALVARLGLLLGIRVVMGLSAPLFHWSSIGWVPEGWVESHQVDAVTGRDLVLLLGGVFLVGKSVHEIHKKTSPDRAERESQAPKPSSFAGALAQIVVLDLVFSLDSVISAIGMAQELWIMVVAMLAAVAFMALFAGKVSRFVDANPTVQVLALAFLVLIGVMLVAEGMGTHVSKGYIYAAMAFAFVVELLNMRARRHRSGQAA